MPHQNVQDPARIQLEFIDDKGVDRKRILNPRARSDRDKILRTILWATHTNTVITIKPLMVAESITG